MIKRHHIEKLLTNFDLGTLIVFEHNLEEWRKSIDLPFTDYTSIFLDPMIPNNNFRVSNPPSPALSSNSVASTSSHRDTPYERPTFEENNRPTITISQILNESPKGIMFTEYYSKYGKFQEEQRNSLVALIAKYFEEKGLDMTLAKSYQLEKELLATFQNEKLVRFHFRYFIVNLFTFMTLFQEYYRTGKRGKVYNKFFNIKSSFQTAVIQHVKPKVKQVCKKDLYQKVFGMNLSNTFF